MKIILIFSRIYLASYFYSHIKASMEGTAWKVSLILAVALIGISAGSTWQWSQAWAFNYLYYSYAAYCDESDLQTWTCKWCREPQVSAFHPTAFPYNRTDDGFGFVGYHPVNKTSKCSNQPPQTRDLSIMSYQRLSNDMKKSLFLLEVLKLIVYETGSQI
jgi:hypothetical protein